MNKKVSIGFVIAVLFTSFAMSILLTGAIEGPAPVVPIVPMPVPPEYCAIEKFFTSVSTAEGFHAENVLIVEIHANVTYTYSIKLIDKQGDLFKLIDLVITCKPVGGVVIEIMRLDGTFTVNLEAMANSVR